MSITCASCVNILGMIDVKPCTVNQSAAILWISFWLSCLLIYVTLYWVWLPLGYIISHMLRGWTFNLWCAMPSHPTGSDFDLVMCNHKATYWYWRFCVKAILASKTLTSWGNHMAFKEFEFDAVLYNHQSSLEDHCYLVVRNHTSSFWDDLLMWNLKPSIEFDFAL